MSWRKPNGATAAVAAGTSPSPAGGGGGGATGFSSAASVASSPPKPATANFLHSTSSQSADRPIVGPGNPVIEALEHYLTRARDAMYVSLQGYHLTDLVPIMGRLSQLSSMTTLNLSHNDLWKLPEDMSSLSSLTALDLSYNQFAMSNLILRGLNSLPKLRQLSINLPAKDEEVLIAQLSGLKVFNGVSIDVTVADGEEGGGGGSPGSGGDSVPPPPPPKGGELTASTSTGTSGVPRQQKPPKKPAYPLSHAELIERMQSGKLSQRRMKEQLDFLKAQRGYDHIVQNTPGGGGGGGGGSPGGGGGIGPANGGYRFELWSNEHTKDMRQMYDYTTKVSQHLAQPEEYEEFQKTVLTHMKARCLDERNPLRIQVHQFHASSLLLEYCMEEVVRAAASPSAIAAAAGGSGAGGGISGGMTTKDIDMAAALKCLFLHVGKQLQTASQLFSAMQEDNDRRVAALQHDLARELLINQTLSGIDGVGGGRTLGDDDCDENDEDAPAGSGGGGGVTPAMKFLQPDGRLKMNVSNNDAALFGRTVGRLAQEEAQRQKEALNQQVALGHLETLAQVRETMDSIIASKFQYVQYNQRAQLPNETMEQHMYTYFSKKFNGDKERVRHDVMIFLESIKKYATTSLDVEVFLKILCFELEDDYWLYHCRFQEQLYQLVFSTLQHSGKGSGGAVNVLDGQITEKDAVRIVETLLSPYGVSGGNMANLDPTSPTVQAMRELIRRVQRRLRGEVLSSSIGYKEFNQIVTRYVMERHLETIRPILLAFYRLDKDRTGVLDAVQVRMIVGNALSEAVNAAAGASGGASMMLASLERQVLESVDPFQHNIAIFSDVVRSLAWAKYQVHQHHLQQQRQAAMNGAPMRTQLTNLFGDDDLFLRAAFAEGGTYRGGGGGGGMTPSSPPQRLQSFTGAPTRDTMTMAVTPQPQAPSTSPAVASQQQPAAGAYTPQPADRYANYNNAPPGLEYSPPSEVRAAAGLSAALSAQEARAQRMRNLRKEGFVRASEI